MRTRRNPGIAAIGVVLALMPVLSCGAPPSGGATTVGAGNARFEFLTATLVRLEYSPSGAFVDAPTAVVEKRDWPQVRIDSREQDGWLIAASEAVTVRYRLRSGAFTAANLEVRWKDRSGAERSWHPGDVDAGNLGGLNYSLDNIAAANLPKDGMDLESPVDDSIPGIDLVLPKAQPGLLSRSGYALIDDSETPAWNAERRWIEARRPAGGQDWYLFIYGRDYHRVLEAYAELCGSIPMIPRYVLGPQITDFNFEYFPGSAQSRRPDFVRYNQQYLLGEVARMRADRIPFDTLILDFAWHNYGWDGGYDWSPLFPQPLELMRTLHQRGVKLSLNDHPGYIHTDESILSFDDSHAPEVLAALGRAAPAKPSFDLDISGGWSFSTDPRRGQWKPIRAGAPWEEQGYAGYRGVGWYRTSVHLPAQLPAKLYLYVGEVARTYTVLINSKEVEPSRIHWPQRLTYSDITCCVARGADNEILLRVEPNHEATAEPRDGILLGPVAIRDVVPPARISFDLSDEKQADVFMRYLHGPLMSQGVDFWWVDGGSGSVDMPGLNKQLWTNKVFYDDSARATGKRAFILGRYGDWGSERYPGFFTGDTYSEWPVLAYEVAFSARGGNVLIPWISHDIGGFHGRRIDFALYARWIEFGAFSGILRMHSAHENPREGNLRMPWIYGQRGVDLMRKYFTLRTQLIPYIYSYAWRAHRRSLPLLSPLYLEYPDVEEAYRHNHEYFFGKELLVAPVLDPAGRQTVWLPPGDWLGFFDGRHYQGGRTLTAQYGVGDTPVFVRAGAIVPEQPASGFSDERPLDALIVNVYGSGDGQFELYEDDGESLHPDEAGQHALTAMRHTTGADGLHHLVIEPAQGGYPGQPQQRSYELRLHGTARPASISVNGTQAGHWTWDSKHASAAVQIASRSIRERLEIAWR